MHRKKRMGELSFINTEAVFMTDSSPMRFFLCIVRGPLQVSASTGRLIPVVFKKIVILVVL